MNYYTYKEFNGTAVCGPIVITVGTEVTEESNIIKYGNNKICLATSANAHEHFVYDGDNEGAERGNLILSIQSKLAENHTVEEIDAEGNITYVDHIAQQRREAIEGDEICAKYVTSTSGEILWNHDFYSATISDLQHIDALLVIEEEATAEEYDAAISSLT